jgi:peptidyl-prolyl cis-trans isomerase A (cyclophilin A)
VAESEQRKKNDMMALWALAGIGGLALVGMIAASKMQSPTLASDDVATGGGGGGGGGDVPKAKGPPITANGAPSQVDGSDPNNGKFTLADAGGGPFVATINTSMGTMTCKLFDDKAPNTVANFVGLASGRRAWKDGNTNKWNVNKPAYDGTTFHRIIAGFMIQGGDPMGSGRGEPGYVIDDEIWGKHDRAGLLCMANRGHNTNGQQFFITDDAAAHLDGNYTIFGECAPVDVVHSIAKVPKQGEKPTTPVTITSIKITKG